MKIFISWSGELSKEIAHSLNKWLPLVLQAIRPYFTPEDIEKGARWGQEISKELETSQAGIFCITKENMNSPWIQFEAGAISKVIESSLVCPILIDLTNSEFKGPLSQFQTTILNKDEVFKLLKTLNLKLENYQLASQPLQESFDTWWPKLEAEVSSIIEKNKNSGATPLRTDRDILEEILGSVRAIVKPEPNQNSLTIRARDSFINSLYSNRDTNNIYLDKLIQERLKDKVSNIGLYNQYIQSLKQNTDDSDDEKTS